MAGRGRGTWSKWGVPPALALSVASLLGVTGTSGAASAPGTAKFTLTGSGRGTLRDGPEAACKYGGINTGGFTELNDLVGGIAGYPGVGHWEIDINEKRSGTFAIKGVTAKQPNAEMSPTLESGNISKSTRMDLFAMSGSVTVHSQTGSLDADFSSTDHKTVKVAGSWSCRAK
jgi:hypothetical protein